VSIFGGDQPGNIGALLRGKMQGTRIYSTQGRSA
jgi:hypothetical protein